MYVLHILQRYGFVPFFSIGCTSYTYYRDMDGSFPSPTGCVAQNDGTLGGKLFLSWWWVKIISKKEVMVVLDIFGGVKVRASV